MGTPAAAVPALERCLSDGHTAALIIDPSSSCMPTYSNECSSALALINLNTLSASSRCHTHACTVKHFAFGHDGDLLLFLLLHCVLLILILRLKNGELS